MESQNINHEDEKIIENLELNIWEALIPVVALIVMLAFNVLLVYGDDALSGSNQFILLLGAAVAGIVGYFRITWKIVNFSCGCQLTARLHSRIHYRFHVCSRSIDRSGITRWS